MLPKLKNQPGDQRAADHAEQVKPDVRDPAAAPAHEELQRLVAQGGQQPEGKRLEQDKAAGIAERSGQADAEHEKFNKMRHLPQHCVRHPRQDGLYDRKQTAAFGVAGVGGHRGVQKNESEPEQRQHEPDAEFGFFHTEHPQKIWFTAALQKPAVPDFCYCTTKIRKVQRAEARKAAENAPRRNIMREIHSRNLHCGNLHEPRLTPRRMNGKIPKGRL